MVIDLKEKRQIVGRVAEFLSYKVRVGDLSQDNGNKIMRVVLDDPTKEDAVTDILDMDLPEAETMKKIEQL